MCGIAGVASLGGTTLPERVVLDRMLGTLRHRGPDASGIHVADGIALGACRLAIIDPSSGDQPLVSDDRIITVTHNGEIYNFRALRQELEARGHRFHTETDGEVLIHGYREWGEGLLERLNGMFCFALHDASRRILLLARDRAGVKPLYYAHLDDYFLWGSEPKAILAHPATPRRLNTDAALEFLTWEYVPAPRTLFRDIQKMEPASLLILDLQNGRARRNTYWSPPLERTDRTASQWLEHLDSTLQSSVERHLVSDVPLGSFLSGGVDSSLILSYTQGVPAFHVSFQESSYSETEYAIQVAGHLGSKLHTRTLEPDLTTDFPLLLESLDDPIADSSLFSTYLLCRSTRQQVKVALSGDGGDELFGGYETYQAERVARLYSLLPPILRTGVVEPLLDSLKPRAAKKGLVNRLKRFVEGARESGRLGHTRWRMFLGRVLSQSLLSDDVKAPNEFTERHIYELFESGRDREQLNQMLWVDFRSYLAENCLQKVDKASMLCSLEARVPLLDSHMLDLAFSMPSRYKIKLFEQKSLLKKLAARRLPRACVYRPKEGFSVPLKHYLRTSFRPLLEQSTTRSRIHAVGLLDVSTVETLKKQHLEGGANHSHILWSIIVLDQWFRRWFTTKA